MATMYKDYLASVFSMDLSDNEKDEAKNVKVIDSELDNSASDSPPPRKRIRLTNGDEKIILVKNTTKEESSSLPQVSLQDCEQTEFSLQDSDSPNIASGVCQSIPEEILNKINISETIKSVEKISLNETQVKTFIALLKEDRQHMEKYKKPNTGSLRKLSIIDDSIEYVLRKHQPDAYHELLEVMKKTGAKIKKKNGSNGLSSQYIVSTFSKYWKKTIGAEDVKFLDTWVIDTLKLKISEISANQHMD